MRHFFVYFLALACLVVGSENSFPSNLVEEFFENTPEGQRKVLIFRGSRTKEEPFLTRPRSSFMGKNSLCELTSLLPEDGSSAEERGTSSEDKICFVGNSYFDPDLETSKNLQNLNLPSNFFDVVILRNCLGLIKVDGAEYNAALDAVKPGGRVYVFLESMFNFWTQEELKSRCLDGERFTVLEENTHISGIPFGCIGLLHGVVTKGTTPTQETAVSLVGISPDDWKYRQAVPDLETFEAQQRTKRQIGFEILKKYKSDIVKYINVDTSVGSISFELFNIRDHPPFQFITMQCFEALVMPLEKIKDGKMFGGKDVPLTTRNMTRSYSSDSGFKRDGSPSRTASWPNKPNKSLILDPSTYWIHLSVS